MEVAVGAIVAQRAFCGVSQLSEEFCSFRMPAGLPPGKGWPELGSSQVGGAWRCSQGSVARKQEAARVVGSLICT